MAVDSSQTYFFKHMLLAVGCTVTSMQTLVANRLFECTAVFDDIFAAVSLPADKVRGSSPLAHYDPVVDPIGEMTAPNKTAMAPRCGRCAREASHLNCSPAITAAGV